MATVLYVDDEEMIGKVVTRFFSRRGDTALIARTLAEAREALLRTDPAAVFIDVWLGTESGFELLNWIEETRPHLSSRVVFVTGELVDADQSERAWKSLGRPFIQKPFDLAALAGVLKSAESRVGT